ncbi:MAG: PAS domain-containing protein, partial [Gemmatimonadetes bacterium]|nr:PAS domain-containing protein [Gemmatimonadota bacterium]
MNDSESVHQSALPVGRKTRAPLALALVAVALMALAVVPIFLGWRAVEVQNQITDDLLPALEVGARLSLVQARQMSRLQSFLLTGNRDYRMPYIAAIAEEDSLYAYLGQRVRAMDFDVRERLAKLSSESARWHFDNQASFDEVVGPVPGSAIQARSQTAYEELQRATRELERAIRSEVNAGRRRLDRVRWLQIWISVGLAVLAFGSTLAVARVGHRLRGYISEAERGQGDAVRARREIDALLEATGDGVLGIDLDGKCTSLNRVGSEILGYTEREIMGRDLHDTVHHSLPNGDSRSRDESTILAALRDGGLAESADRDVLWRRRRRALPARWSLRPLIDGKTLRGAVLTFTDMTEIQEKEDALRLAVAQREEVVSIVSHDLRNPLGVVAAAADLLLELPLDDQERRQQADI